MLVTRLERLPGRPMTTLLWTVQSDLQPMNIGLLCAWQRAQDRCTWMGIVKTGALESEAYTSWWWWWWILNLCFSFCDQYTQEGQCSGLINNNASENVWQPEPLSFCLLSLCWAHEWGWAVQKRLDRSRCRLGADSLGLTELFIRRGRHPHYTRRGNFGFVQPIEKHWESLLRCLQQKRSLNAQ